MRRGLAAALAVAMAVNGCVARGEDAERRLTNDAAASRITFNFARSIAVDAGEGVHAVWYEEEGSNASVRYARSLDGGRTWDLRDRLSDLDRGGQHPSIAASGSNVIVLWHTRDPRPSVMVRRSTDRGATWDAARPLAAPEAGAAHAVVAADGARVHAIWGDNRGATGEIFTAASSDAGATWSEPVRLSEPGSFSWVPTIAVEGRIVLAAWVDYRDGNEEEYIRRSDDGGATWSPAQRVSDDAADSWAPSLALVGGVAHLAWFDRRDAALQDDDVERAADEALAVVGLPPEARLERDPETYYLQAFTARIQERMRRIQARAPEWVRAGGDQRRLEDAFRAFESAMRDWSSSWEIYYRRSADGGVTWGPETRLTDAPGESARPSLAVLNADVRVVWFDGRDGNQEIYEKRSTDGGATWGPDRRLTHATGNSMHPSLAIGPTGVGHVIWHDERDGNSEIYYRAVAP